MPKLLAAAYALLCALLLSACSNSDTTAPNAVIDSCQSALSAPDGSACSIEQGVCQECIDKNDGDTRCACKGVRCTNGKIEHFDDTLGACPEPDGAISEASSDVSVAD